MTLLSLNNVSHRYTTTQRDQTHPALSDISFAVKQNEICVIIGPSGCGKSTLLNLIAGFFQPTEGTVLFNDHPITAPSVDRTIIFQDYLLFPWYTVRKNIEFGLAAQQISADKRSAISDELLQLVDLCHVADFYPYQLSGGMKQRVALARALAVNPQLLLMDEPFGALDEQTRSFLQQSLLRIWEIKKTTIVFVTHSIDEALMIGHTIIVLSNQPATIKHTVTIDRPFPRDLIKDPFFQETKLTISNLLRDEYNNVK